VAFGVLLDTLVVRSVLVTALNLDIGHWIWWPSKLARESIPEPEQRAEESTAVS
jgi:RND superfamily putative drug exporter